MTINVLVTAGGTTEKIDNVRGITNFSTGTLGSLIADAFASHNAVDVDYVHGLGSKMPVSDTIVATQIESVDDLLRVIEEKLTSKTYDVVVHAMAVSDYYLVGSIGEQELTKQLFSDESSLDSVNFVDKLDESFDKVQSVGKLGSDMSTLYMQLKETPKVIREIKKLQPTTKLVGFKLLVDVSEEKLVSVAESLMEKNDCDYVLANDKSLIKEGQHIGLLVSSDGNIQRFNTKESIAEGIAVELMRENRK